MIINHLPKTGSAQETVFQDLPIPSALRKMIIPAVTSQLTVLIYNMADTFFVGQTNNPYMVAATSLILPVFNIPPCLAGLAGIGGGSLISRLLGAGENTYAYSGPLSRDRYPSGFRFRAWIAACIYRRWSESAGTSTTSSTSMPSWGRYSWSAAALSCLEESA